MAVKSLAAQLKKVKLPKVAYHLDNNDRITKITDLEMSESASKRSCDCTVVKALETVTDETELSAHVNKHEVSLSDCYPTLPSALEALRLQIMTREMMKFKHATLNSRQASNGWLMKQLKCYPDLVLTYVLKNEDVDSELTVDKLTREHYRLALANGLDGIRKIVINRKFPELAKADDDADED